MFLRSQEKTRPERRKVTPRRILAAGLVTMALASAGCETGEQSDQSKESKAKVTQILKGAATKAARQALKIQKEHPDSVLYTDKQKGEQSISIYVEDKDYFPGIGTYHDTMSLDVTMGTDPTTGKPDPDVVSEVRTDISLERKDPNGDKVTHNSNAWLSSDVENMGEWYSMFGGTTTENGKTLENLTTGFDTRYPIGDVDQDAIETAQLATQALASDIEIIQTQLK